MDERYPFKPHAFRSLAGMLWVLFDPSSVARRDALLMFAGASQPFSVFVTAKRRRSTQPPLGLRLGGCWHYAEMRANRRLTGYDSRPGPMPIAPMVNRQLCFFSVV
jgi:hypothetical protein